MIKSRIAGGGEEGHQQSELKSQCVKAGTLGLNWFAMIQSGLDCYSLYCASYCHKDFHSLQYIYVCEPTLVFKLLFFLKCSWYI